MVPFDDKSPFITSGIRIGTSAMTSRGFGKEEFEQVFEWIDYIVNNISDDTAIAKVKAEVNDYMKKYPLYPELA